MANPKTIVFAFASFGKAAEPLVFTIGNECFSSPGQYLMPIGLVAHIPYQLIVRGIKNIMQRYRQLHYAQAGPEMPPMHAHHVDDVLS